MIVFFSHVGENYAVGNIKVGNTKIVDEYIRERTGADEFEIVAEKSYDMPYSDLTKLARKETGSGELPPFKGTVNDIEQYDTIFIGCPVWWGTYPQVMFTFFKKYARNFFSNYLIVNGAIFAAVGIIAVAMFALYASSRSSIGFGPTALLVLVLLLLSVFLVLFVICFPIAYTQLLEEAPYRTDISAKEIFDRIRVMLPRAFAFGFISFFVIGIPFGFILLWTIKLFDGEPVLLQLVSAFMSTFMVLFLQQFMLIYIKDKMDYFPALGKVFNQLKVGFWDKFGATFVMSLIIYAITTAGFIVPMVVYLVVLGGLSGFEATISNTILVFILLLIIITVVFVASNFQTFLQILIHFGEKDGEYTDEIDLIGQNAKEE